MNGHDELAQVIAETVAAGPALDGKTNRYAAGLPAPVIAAGMCGCGRPPSHRGRCRFRIAAIAAGTYTPTRFKKRQAKISVQTPVVAKVAPVVRPKTLTEFDNLLVNSRGKLYGYAKSLTHDATAADDLVSKACLRMLEKRDQFQPGTEFLAWAFTIVRNMFYDDKRREKNHVSLMVEREDGTFTERVEPQLTTPALQESGLHARDMARKVLTLPDPQRKTVLQATEGVPYSEIATKDGVSVGTVKSRVSRARSILNDDDRVTPPPPQRPVNKIGFSSRVLRPAAPAASDPYETMMATLKAERARIDDAIAALEKVRHLVSNKP